MGTSKSVVYKKAVKFSIEILKACKYLMDRKEYVMSRQLMRSGTSIGANIAEANGAISKADFSAKMSIAYKEALETKYWLVLLLESKYLSEDSCEQLFAQVDELAKILYSILRTTRFPKYT